MIDVKKTQEWWRSVLANPLKLAMFLLKLERTEYSGYTEHMEFVEASQSLSDRQIAILHNIAIDEATHSRFLVEVIEDRKILLPAVDIPNSLYWDIVLKDCVGYNDYCAANFYGEALACDRFNIMFDMPETPSDIREFIDLALPDETFHKITLKKEAGEESLAKIKALDEKAKKLVLGY